MAWACILLPTLALDTALRQREPSTRPFALVAGSAQQRRLIAVDPHARAAGLEPGQRLAAAEAVCPGLATAEYDPRRTRSSLDLIAAWAYRYSSEVRVDPPRAVDLEVAKSFRLFGPWSALEARLRGELAALGFQHRIALAPTPRAARILARARDGAAVATSAELPRAMAHVPVLRAGLPGDTAARLTGMGIRTLGALLALPRPALQRRFGKALVESLDLLLGAKPEALAAYRPPDRFDARMDFGCEVRHAHALLFPLRRMLGDLAAYLAARDGGVERFTLRCIHADHAPTDLTLGLLAPERDATALFEVAKLRLEQTALPAPVIELELHADALPPFVPAGTDLLDARTANVLPWPQLVDRLRARLGPDAVYRLRTDPDPRPERAYACAAAGSAAPAAGHKPAVRPHSHSHAGAATRAGADTGSGAPVREPAASYHGEIEPEPAAAPGLPRPTWLLPRPIPLRGPAPRVLAGPERLETGWWDGDDLRRDYYVVELTTGQRAWVFAAPGERGPFMLHGWYA